MLVEDDFPLRCNVASSGGQLVSVDTNVVENRCFTFFQRVVELYGINVAHTLAFLIDAITPTDR